MKSGDAGEEAPLGSDILPSRKLNQGFGEWKRGVREPVERLGTRGVPPGVQVVREVRRAAGEQQAQGIHC